MTNTHNTETAISATDRNSWRGTIVRLIRGAAPTIESAEDWYESLSWHTEWQSEYAAGQVHHPVCSLAELDALTDEQILAARCPKGCEEKQDAYLDAIAYARAAADAARSVYSSLSYAVESAQAGDLAGTLAYLRAASAVESDYGDDPGVQRMADELLEDDVLDCECGAATGERCSCRIERGDAYAIVEWMPEQHRASHEAAGNWGSWPQNGSKRLRVSLDCAESLVAGEDPEVARVVREEWF